MRTDCTLLRPGPPGDPTLCGTSRWHSGPQHWPRQRHEYYNVTGGQISSGLTVVAYELRDVGTGDGGMGAIPGSHKSEFEFTFDEQITGDGDLPSCAKAIDNVAAGDAIVFTEASAPRIF